MRDLEQLTGHSIDEIRQLRMQQLLLDPRDVQRAAEAHGVPERELGDTLRWGAIVWPDPAGGCGHLEGLSAFARGAIDCYLRQRETAPEAIGCVWLFLNPGTGPGTVAVLGRIRRKSETQATAAVGSARRRRAARH